MKMPSKKLFALGTATALACTALTVGCANPKKPVPKTTLPAVDNANNAGGSAGNPTANANLEEAIKSASGPDGLNKEDVKKLVTQYLGGKVDPSVLPYLFDAGSEKDSKLKPEEIKTRVPTLSWATAKHGLAPADLDAQLAKVFPESSRTARDGVAELIGRFDEKWLGGNEDKNLQQTELLTAGLIMGMVKREDFSKGLSARFKGADDQATANLNLLMVLKLNQQLYGRYAVSDFTKLPSDDQKLEWVQLLLRKQLILQQLKGFADKKVALNDLKAFFERWQIVYRAEDKELWTKAFNDIYDAVGVFTGDGDKKLNESEAFNLITDVRYANAVLKAFEGALNGPGAAKHENQVTTLASFYPKTGSSLLLDGSGKLQTDFWNSLGDQTPNLPTALIELDLIALDEAAFANFDKNNDGKLEKDEAAALLKNLKMDPAVVEAIFADKKEDGLTPNETYQKLKSYFMPWTT